MFLSRMFNDTQLLRLHSFGDELMSSKHWWNGDRDKPKYYEKNLSKCDFVHQKSHMDWPVFETSP
jgi:hypothetical protein